MADTVAKSELRQRYGQSFQLRIKIGSVLLNQGRGTRRPHSFYPFGLDVIVIIGKIRVQIIKSVYMHFRPGKYSSCARAREFGNEKHLKIADHTLMKVEKVKFLSLMKNFPGSIK